MRFAAITGKQLQKKVTIPVMKNFVVLQPGDTLKIYKKRKMTFESNSSLKEVPAKSTVERRVKKAKHE
eukprot:10820845-Karenia_brevis.AAC.1